MAYNPKYNAYIDEWSKENAVRISMKLMKSTDADILAYLEGKPSKQGEIKRLVRLAMEIEKGKENEQTDKV